MLEVTIHFLWQYLLDPLLHQEGEPRGEDATQAQGGETIIDAAAHLHVLHTALLEFRVVGIDLSQDAINGILQTSNERIRRRIRQTGLDHGIFGKQDCVIRIVEGDQCCAPLSM